MTPILHLAFRAARPGSTRSPSLALAPLLLSSTAIVALFVASSSALAQVPPGYDPSLQYGLGLIGAPAAWKAGYTGAGVTIAVGDSGIDTTHTAFTGKIDPRSMNFVLPYKGAPYDPKQITNLNSHGTHVSGIALASGDSSAPGVAYNANVVMLRVWAASPSCLKAGAKNCNAPGIPNPFASSLNYFADLSNVNIFNASYGPTIRKGTKNLEQWPTYALGASWEAAALNAISKGKIIVASTGNERARNPVAGGNPKGLPLLPFVQPGANADAGVYDPGNNNYNFSSLLQQSGLIIGVTSVGENKTIAFDAQMCGVAASWCVAAPGVGIYSTLPGDTYGSLSAIAHLPFWAALEFARIWRR
jgi:subtilisin family serine protease